MVEVSRGRMDAIRRATGKEVKEPEPDRVEEAVQDALRVQDTLKDMMGIVRERTLTNEEIMDFLRISQTTDNTAETKADWLYRPDQVTYDVRIGRINDTIKPTMRIDKDGNRTITYQTNDGTVLKTDTQTSSTVTVSGSGMYSY